MSRTDKHRPLYAQLADETNPSWWKRETHYHRYPWGPCDLKIPDDKTVDPRIGRRLYNFLRELNERRGCHIWVSSAGWRQGMWAKGRARPRRISDPVRDGAARVELRRLKHKWLTTAEVEDIDSTENLPTNQWLWERNSWSWD